MNAKPIDCQHIRNFSIVAHIDHGKSTLADRLLEVTGTVSQRNLKAQILDDMELERARGITIKARAVVIYFERDGERYELNLIDTPGHVDFHYEVSRSLACCEGALLLVDAAQGVEAQTVANAYAALEHDLDIIPVLNKVDMQNARPDDVAEEMHTTLGINPDEVLRASAKTGLGVDGVLDAIIDRIQAPSGDPEAPLQAMVFDAVYDAYRGAIAYVRLMNGRIQRGQKIRFLQTGKVYEVSELGQFAPQRLPCEELSAGQVGYVICNIKTIEQVRIGDTMTSGSPPHADALPGYEEPKRMVYCGLYPADGGEFEQLRESLSRLALNDSSFEFEPETSDALGFGFRCGFLGLLHMEIVQQRLEREDGLDLVQTAPTVTYELLTKDGRVSRIYNPQKLPPVDRIEEFRQPIVRVSLVLPTEFIGGVMKLCTDRRGEYVRTEYLSPTRALLVFDMPLAEVIYDLHDRTKSVTRGFGTLDYEFLHFAPANLVKLDVLVNSNRVDALSTVCHREDAEKKGRAVVKKLKTEIERHMFEIPIQAAIGTRVVARETIKALRKNVTAKCYGGDISRKRKLWAKQREGKKRMKSIGSVDIPQTAFLAVLEAGGDG